MPELFRYAAFISYSSKDARFAHRLHRALEAYGIPSSLGKFDLIGGGKRNRIYPVFRDREELSAGHLGDQIKANLRASAALIVVCSQSGAASPWVQKEIEFFAAQGRHNKIFAIISDTAPLSDETGADATQSCFPPAFRGDALAGDKLEPLAADARKGKDGFRNAWLKIVAGMIGVTPGQIIDRDRRRRRQQALRAAAASALVLLGVGYTYSQRPAWEPLAISWLEYRRYVDDGVALARAPAGTTFQDCRDGSTDCPIMVVLPAGDFLMGSLPDDPENFGDESPQRRMSISSFAVSQREITFADWQACLNAGGCFYRPQQIGDMLHDPVTGISWEDARLYVGWLSRMTDQQYRLLSEAEWEYSARAVTRADAAQHTRFSWGNDNPACDRNARNGAAFSACAEQHVFPTGSFQPNAFGLYDMHGNAWEMVEDCYGPYDPSNPSFIVIGDCPTRVNRGGGWSDDPRTLRSAVRGSSPIEGVSGVLGFRVARTLNSTTPR